MQKQKTGNPNHSLIHILYLNKNSEKMDHRTRCGYTTKSENLYNFVLLLFLAQKKVHLFKKGIIRLHQN